MPVRVKIVIVTLFPEILHETVENPNTAAHVAVELTTNWEGNTIEILSPATKAVLGVIVTRYESVSPLTAGGLSMEMEPEMMDLAVVVLTTRPEETVSMVFPEESVVVTLKEAEVPTYLRLVTPGILAVRVVRADTLEAKKPLKKMEVPPLEEEQGGLEVLMKEEMVQPLAAVTAASETETPGGKSILRMPPAMILLAVVKVKVYSVLGFAAVVLFMPMKVGVIMFGVITNIVELLTQSTK